MENTTTKNSNSLNCGFAIKTLSIISLVCAILHSMSYFLRYGSQTINGEDKLYFSFPLVSKLIVLLLLIAPVILFIVYIFKFHNETKATIMVPIVFGIIALNVANNFFVSYAGFLVGSIGFSIFKLISIVCLILAIISALKGFNKKTSVVISMIVCLFLMAFYISVFYKSYIILNYHFLSYQLMRIISPSMLYVALLLFALKNKIPPIISVSPKKEKKSIKEMTPEQALKLLKGKRELGMITEEEYQAQRTEIISKL